MPAFSDYKTYGAIMSAVGAYLAQALATAHKQHFGTPNYFRARSRLVHLAFDKFSVEHNLSPGEASALRTMIERHSSTYPHLRTVGVEVLCHELPEEFNVRGAWMSPRVELAES